MVCNAMIKIQISIFVDQTKIRGHTVVQYEVARIFEDFVFSECS